MKLFSKILFVFTLTIFILPNGVFADTTYNFNPSLAFNNSCKIVITYKLTVTPVNINNVYKLTIVPLDIVTDVPQNNLGIDYPINIPLDGSANGSITSSFTQHQSYKLQVVEYSSTDVFLTNSTSVNITPAPGNCAGNDTEQDGGEIQPPPAVSGGDSTSFNIDIDNPISVNSIPDLIQKVLEGLIKIGIPLLVVMIVYSGFLYLFARGEPAKITAAHEMLKYTLIGGAILLGAWALAQLIHTTLIEITASIIQYFV